MSMKNPLTPAGIEPETYRFVAQHLNHCATAVPIDWNIEYLKKLEYYAQQTFVRVPFRPSCLCVAEIMRH